MKTFAWLAAAADAPLRPGVVRSSGVATDLLLVLGAGVLLFAVLMLWVVYSRRHRPHRHRHRHHRSSNRTPSVETGNSESGADEDSEHSRHHRRRRRRREHRGRNPTLSETGGLPPPRPDGALPPAP